MPVRPSVVSARSRARELSLAGSSNPPAPTRPNIWVPQRPPKVRKAPARPSTHHRRRKMARPNRSNIAAPSGMPRDPAALWKPGPEGRADLRAPHYWMSFLRAASALPWRDEPMAGRAHGGTSPWWDESMAGRINGGDPGPAASACFRSP
ncbi:hypothetical protein FRACA_20055 [Frankia canadensis]|uniref:Uncharacterized protein n=1 Tax=Frankia canadensis TaxID=1836972 RepID=A0A2I2KPS9_9ACTN|nr:hypothetical protein FRACA_20055 [Frankia canadensis]SOU54949.1 hypothetical protein FRACA_20055 [Frankia canadensis]